MTRWHVEVAQLRARDVLRGDVVARDPHRQDGWFRVHEVNTLPDGQINILDKSNVRSFIAGPFDMVGLQTPVAPPPGVDGSTDDGTAPTQTADGVQSHNGGVSGEGAAVAHGFDDDDTTHTEPASDALPTDAAPTDATSPRPAPPNLFGPPTTMPTTPGGGQ